MPFLSWVACGLSADAVVVVIGSVCASVFDRSCRFVSCEVVVVT